MLDDYKAMQALTALRMPACRRGACGHEHVIVFFLSGFLEIFECDRCVFYCSDVHSTELKAFSHTASSRDEILEHRVPMSKLLESVLLQGKLANIADAWSDLRFSRTEDKDTGYRTRSLLCVPVMAANGKVVAALQVSNRRHPGPFVEREERLLGMAAAMIADVYFAQKRFDSGCVCIGGAKRKPLPFDDIRDANVKDMIGQFHDKSSLLPS